MITTTRISPRSLISGLAALVTLGAASPAFAQSPANDLTITVSELANGDVQFTASGTSQMLMAGSFYTTNADSSTQTPPHNRPSNLSQHVELPEGLVLTVPFRAADSEEESAPEEGNGSYRQLPLNYLFFNSGYWHMGSFYSGPLQENDSITGSGSVTVSKSEFPFSDFEPGTFTSRRYPWGMGEEFYDLTYKVIPYSPETAVSGLGVSKPKTFPATEAGSSSTQTITITNLGSGPISGLKVQIPKSGKKNFEVTRPKSTTLAAGASTTFEATFQPQSGGTKVTRINVTDGTSSETVLLKGRALEKAVKSPRTLRRP